MKYPIIFRKRVIAHYKKSNNKSKTCSLFEISVVTLNKWLDMLEQNGNLEDAPLKRGWRKLNPDLLKEYVTINPDLYIKDYANYFGVTISCVWDALKRLGFTRKKRLYCIKSGMKKNEKYLQKI